MPIYIFCTPLAGDVLTLGLHLPRRIEIRGPNFTYILPYVPSRNV